MVPHRNADELEKTTTTAMMTTSPTTKVIGLAPMLKHDVRTTTTWTTTTTTNAVSHSQRPIPPWRMGRGSDSEAKILRSQLSLKSEKNASPRSPSYPPPRELLRAYRDDYLAAASPRSPPHPPSRELLRAYRDDSVEKRKTIGAPSSLKADYEEDDDDDNWGDWSASGLSSSMTVAKRKT